MLHLLPKPVALPPRTSRVGESVVKAIMELDTILPFVIGLWFAMHVSDGHYDAAAAVYIVAVSAALMRFGCSEGRAFPAFLGLFLALDAVAAAVWVAYAGNIFFGMLLIGLVATECLARFLALMHEGDMNRLFHAIARTRRGLITHDAGVAARYAAEALNEARSYDERGSLADEVHELAVSTRREIPLPGGTVLRFTTDDEAKQFGLHDLENHLRSMRRVSFPRFIAFDALKVGIGIAFGLLVHN